LLVAFRSSGFRQRTGACAGVVQNLPFLGYTGRVETARL